jgi:hypothetical protein
VDEDVLVEGENLVGLGLEDGQILRQVVDAAQRHAAGEPALQGRRLVVREVDADAAAHESEDLPERRLVVLAGRELARHDIRVLAQADELLGELG